MSQAVCSPSPGLSPTIPVMKLKSERVQEMLAAMPAWALLPEGEAIGRVFSFPSARVASTFAGYVSAYAGEEGHNVYLDVSKGEVSLVVAGPEVRGRRGGLTEEVVAFAQIFG